MRAVTFLVMLLAPAVYAATGCTAVSTGPAGDAGPSATADSGELGTLGMNDVSVLIPLPPNPDGLEMLAPDTAGRGGVLFPEGVFTNIPVFTPTVEDFERSKLRAIAVRFDGCFRKTAAEPCEAQIRIVMQPLGRSEKDDGTIGTGGMDSAAHLFYRIENADFAKLVHELRKLRSLAPEATPDSPLQVHPSLKAQGVSGAYGKALFGLVRTYAGAENLARVTFFLRTPSNADQWNFGGFVKTGGTWAPLDIPGVGNKQQVTAPTSQAPAYDYQVFPVATTPEDLTVALSSQGMANATKEAREAAVVALMRTENPNVHSADSIQCASCHISTVVGAISAQTYGLSLASLKDTYVSPSGRNLSLTGGLGPTSVSVLRAFGWAGQDAAISRRVVHESAEVLDDLQKRFPEPAN